MRTQRGKIQRMLVSLTLMVGPLVLSAQHEFEFWEDTDNLHAAFLQDPSYLTSSEGMFALPSISAGMIGNGKGDNGLFGFIGAEMKRTFQNDFSDGQVSIFTQPESGENFLSRTERNMLGAFSFRHRFKNDTDRRATWRVAYFTHRSLNMTYNEQFAKMASAPRFSIEIPYAASDSISVAYGTIAYRGVAIGGSIEVMPMRTYVGANVKVLGGESFTEVEEVDGLAIIQSKGVNFVFEQQKQDPSFQNGIGGALDIGITHRLTRQWSISASAIDLGYISWTSADERQFTATYPEVLLGTVPVNEITGQEYLDAAYAPIMAEVSQTSKNVRTSLNSRVNLVGSGELGRLGVYGLFSQGVGQAGYMPDQSIGAAKLSYRLIDSWKARLKLTSGGRYADDTGLSFTSSFRLDLNAFDAYFGVNGFGQSAAPYSRSMLMLGMQININGRADRDRH